MKRLLLPLRFNDLNNQILFQITVKYLPITLFFLIFLIIGLSIFRDYGVSWDEPIQRDIGNINISYIIGKDSLLLDFNDRFYGPTYEILLIGIEKSLGLSSLRDVFFLRHFLTFITFFIGLISFYLLSKNIYRNTSTAILSSIALVLSPRIFENAFYNTKDIPLLVFFILCFTLLFKYMDTGKLVVLLLLSVYSALTMTIRIAGMLIPFLTIVVIITHTMHLPISNKRKFVSASLQIGLFLLLFIFVTILFWPILWTNPLGHFLQTLRQISHYNWPGTVLFMGKVYLGSEIPRSYSVVWILITTPIVYSILFFFGITNFLIDVRYSWRNILFSDGLKLIFLAAWFFTPLLSVIILKSVLYDSWRHLFFIYPAFVLLAFWGFERFILLLKNKVTKLTWLPFVAYLTLTISFCFTAKFMILAHPYQQVYFNCLAGKNLVDIKENFDMDYWGLSYRNGLEFIAKHDPSPVIPIIAETSPGEYIFILPEKDLTRFLPVKNESEAKYLLTNFRYTKSYPPYLEVYSVEVEGAKILSVFKLE